MGEGSFARRGLPNSGENRTISLSSCADDSREVKDTKSSATQSVAAAFEPLSNSHSGIMHRPVRSTNLILIPLFVRNWIHALQAFVLVSMNSPIIWSRIYSFNANISLQKMNLNTKQIIPQSLYFGFHCILITQRMVSEEPYAS